MFWLYESMLHIPMYKIVSKELCFLKLQLGGQYSIKTVAILEWNTMNISYKYCINTIVSELDTIY